MRPPASKPLVLLGPLPTTLPTALPTLQAWVQLEEGVLQGLMGHWKGSELGSSSPKALFYQVTG